ncbi:DNA-formamidopyrimidine glycosylase family protein [uncultured Jannaschia sp.]|uniref:Fpg/Nei family DNA glycosylase n=1 Tax=uncultured Jannaschia sp. TaxID=293347 RepID=UPI002601884D|nr:DNA-formamidopyrimidine glycosylase family protein [uncultured Jannaschia sp.]
MPELPEVETFRRRIDAGALNRTVAEIRPGNDITHVELPDAAARARFEGHQFTQTRRHGKYIFVGSASGPWLNLHMGMSGSVRVYDTEDGDPDYARLVVIFEGDRRMAFRDPRKFGWVRVVENPDAEIARLELGPDALEIDASQFADRIEGRGAIKSALIDQAKLAGIGNLWADETLYQTGIHPDTRAGDLSGKQRGDLHRTFGRILKAVCDVDAHYADLPDPWLIHRRKTGHECGRCGGTIESRKVGGRTSFYCPDHQERAT